MFVLMGRRLPGLFDSNFWSGVGRMTLATFIMSFVTYGFVKLIGLEFADQTILMVLPQLAVISIASIAAYIGISKLLRLEEVAPVVKYIKKITLGRSWVNHGH